MGVLVWPDLATQSSGKVFAQFVPIGRACANVYGSFSRGVVVWLDLLSGKSFGVLAKLDKFSVFNCSSIMVKDGL